MRQYQQIYYFRYDLCIDKLEKDPVVVQGRLYVGDLVMHDCQIKFVNEIMKIEVPICQYAESVERTDIPLSKYN